MKRSGTIERCKASSGIQSSPTQQHFEASTLQRSQSVNSFCEVSSKVPLRTERRTFQQVNTANTTSSQFNSFTCFDTSTYLCEKAKIFSSRNLSRCVAYFKILLLSARCLLHAGRNHRTQQSVWSAIRPTNRRCRSSSEKSFRGRFLTTAQQCPRSQIRGSNVCCSKDCCRFIQNSLIISTFAESRSVFLLSSAFSAITCVFLRRVVHHDSSSSQSWCELIL